MEPHDVTAWSSLLLGMVALFAGTGALRQPGAWRTMVEEITGSPALQFLSGVIEMLVGALTYFGNPWLPADVLACVLKTMGGLMLVEAFAILGFCDIYSQMWIRNLAAMHRGWATFTALGGLVLTVAGAARFH